MNNIKLLGRLTKNPELKKTSGGRNYAWFTVAVPRGNDRNKADFIRCVAFDKLAEAISTHCQKGRQILVDGRLEITIRTDETTQVTRTLHSVVAANITFLHKPTTEVA